MNRSFFRNAGLLAVAEMVARLKGFVIIPLLTHRFHTVGYGVWSQVVVIVALFGPVVILGTDSAVVRYLSGIDRETRARSFLGWIFAVTLFSVFVCGLIALFRHSLSVVAFGEAGEYARYVPLAAASILASILLSFSRTWFRLENDALRLSVITIGQAVFSVVALILMYALGQGLYHLVIYTMLGDGLLGVLTLLGVIRKIGVPKPDFSLLPRFLRYGIVLLPAGYAVWLLNWVDRLFLVHYDNLRAVGLYSLAYNLGYLAIQVVVNPIWTMFPNRAAELWNGGERLAVQHLFQSTAGAVFALIVPTIVGAALFGRGVLHVLAPPAFAHAAPVISIVLGGYLCFMLSAYYEIAFGLIHRQALGSVTVGIACGVNVALNFLLIPRYSYTGAAIATLLAFAFELALCVAISRHLELLTTPVRFPALVVVASVLMGVSLLPLKSFVLRHGIGGLLLGGGFGLFVYTGLCRLVGVLAPGLIGDEVRRLRRYLAFGPAR